MATIVEICNIPLVTLGAAPIQDLYPKENTVPARLAATFYAISRDEVLRSHPWNFAAKRVRLAPLADAPVSGYARAFKLPADWLRTIEVSADDWKHENGCILCDESSIVLRYIYRLEDESRFDSLFTVALGYSLGTKMAYPLTKSTTQVDVMTKLYAEYLQLARSVDAQEDPAEQFGESDMINVRS